MNIRNPVKAVALLVGLFVLILVGCESTTTSSSRGKYDVKFGLMSTAQSGGFPFVFQETNMIELIADGSYAHGFTVARRGGGQFFVEYAIRFPKPIEDFPESFLQHGRLLEDGHLYHADGKLVWDRALETFYFSKTDPLGTYELMVYLDGELYRTYRYDVVKPVFNVGY